MTTDVIIETNFIVSFAKGQRAANAAILRAAETGALSLNLPESCLMEAVKWYEKTVRTYNAFSSSVSQRIRELLRADDLAYAREQIATLDTARIENERYKNDVHGRLFECCERLARISLLYPLSRRWLLDRFNEQIIKDDADDMILASILAANGSREKQALFLTENRSDFAEEPVISKLAAVNITLVFDPFDVLRAVPESR